MNGDNGESAFGVSHLGSLPITMSFGVVLLFALAVLVFLRIVFGEIRVSGGARV